MAPIPKTLKEVHANAHAIIRDERHSQLQQAQQQGCLLVKYPKRTEVAEEDETNRQGETTRGSYE